ncbi:sodium channel protein Nach-like [Cardiocondyla obscurior]|uniref:sodium channel protein Nach-like n=1 Tax=Cardiocondyla obscurior TaxID=286306 RepID=UPI0039657C6C
MLVERNKVRPRNTFVRRAWQKKNSESISKSRTATKYLKLYCQYSSLNTLKYLVDSQRPLFERLLWVTIHCIIVSFLVFMVYISYREFVTIPLITSMETDSYRTTNLDFPGIAICSVNRISRQSASGLAIDIFNSNVTRQSLDEILDAIEQLGDLYPSDFDTIASRNVEIDQLLTTYYKGPYNITDIMKDLTPKCTVILLKCKLHGSYRNCSNLFEFRKTQDGFCCTFNYARESDDILDMAYAIQPDVHQVMDLGIERGLTVVMDPLLDDYFYSILPTVGWKVLVFNPTDFPDMTSGGVTEVLAMPLTETFLDVSATAFVSTKSVESFPREKRNCIFSDENSPMRGSTMYTYSDCIVDCKIYYIQKFCGCRPFFYPRRGPKEC